MTNSQYKLLVVDIDGTLLGRNGTISDENKKALARAGASGVRVSLSTGRVVQATLDVIDQLSLDSYHVFFDGALVSDPETGEEVYVEPIPKEMVSRMVEVAHRNEIDINLYSTGQFFIERETWATDLRRDFFGLQPTIMDFGRSQPEETIIKAAIVVGSPEDKAKADSFIRHFRGSLSFFVTRTPALPDIDFINVVAFDVSKGKALEALTSHLGIALDEVMTIGDGANDISLLSRAGLGIAMGNATAELKAVADYVTLDVDHNGVAAAINKFLL